MNVATLALSCSALVLGVPQVAAQAQSNKASAQLQELITDYEQLIREADPVSASREGDREALRRLPDVRPEAERERHDRLVGLADRLSRIDAAELPPGAVLNHRLLARIVAESVEEAGFDFSRIAFQNDDGFHTLADYLARTTTVASRDDAEAWLARLEALPAYYEQNLANLRRGIRTKLTQPAIVVGRVRDVARQQAAVGPEESALLLPLARMPTSIPPPVQAEYRARAVRLIGERILPAQRSFAEFLEREYAPAARAAIGWRSVPDGDASYRFLVRRETTTRMTPEEIHALGQSEVARIRHAMEATIRETGFEGSFAEFLELLRTDPRFYARTPQELLEKASEIAKRADDGLPALFGTLPRLPYGVRPVPADLAEGYTTGRYWQGSLPLGQAGGYMVNTSHLDQRPLYELPALTVHEAVPGHHLQIALAQELGDLPYFRRHVRPTAFIEGWGLYSEYLGEEMGIYRDPYEQFGRYSYEMWRACRLVADTGIHWLGWDIEQARRCFTENSALAPHNIQTELERYISWPAQALAYKIGELRLRGLRREAEQALGESFDVRGFHDLLLLGGALPLDVVESRVSDWIHAQPQPLTGGGEVSMRHDGDMLFLTITGPEAGLASVCVASENQVRILHASAAIGEAVYDRDGRQWTLKRGFEWGLRDPTAQQRDEFLARTGWLANADNTGSSPREFRIRLDDRTEHLAVTFLTTSEPMTLAYWPPAMADDGCRQMKVAQGFLPETATFSFETWHRVPRDR